MCVGRCWRLVAPCWTGCWLRSVCNIAAPATTRPGTLLRHQVPIRTDWNENGSGLLEVDTVAMRGIWKSAGWSSSAVAWATLIFPPTPTPRCAPTKRHFEGDQGGLHLRQRPNEKSQGEAVHGNLQSRRPAKAAPSDGFHGVLAVHGQQDAHHRFRLFKPHNLRRAVLGEKVGTLVS